MSTNKAKYQALVKFKDNIIEELKSFFNECNIVLDSTECYSKLLEITDESELFIPYQDKVIILLFTFNRDWTFGMFHFDYCSEQDNDTVTHYNMVPTLELLKKRVWHSTTLDDGIQL